jgi:hypothetical protein
MRRDGEYVYCRRSCVYKTDKFIFKLTFLNRGSVSEKG